jgi:hypothetical protein
MTRFSILSVKSISVSDYALQLEVGGVARKFFARRVGHAEAMPVVGSFEPAREFRDLPLEVHQLRELMSTVFTVHAGGSPQFPIVLGESHHAAQQAIAADRPKTGSG